MTINRCTWPLNELHQTIVDLGARPVGVGNRCLRVSLGITAWAASSALHAAERAERVLCVKHSGELDNRRRWFVDRDASELWLAGPAPARIKYPKRPRPTKTSAIREPGPKIERDRAPQGHAWRPAPGRPGS